MRRAYSAPCIVLRLFSSVSLRRVWVVLLRAAAISLIKFALLLSPRLQNGQTLFAKSKRPNTHEGKL